MQKFLGIIFGIIFIAIGVFMYIRNDTLVKNCTEEVKAVVVDMKQELSSDDDGTSYMYYPIIEYKAGNDTVRITMSTGSNIPKYQIDDEITVLYNPKKTKEFIVKGEKTLSIFSIVFVAV